MLIVRGKKLSFIIHLEFLNNKHRPMIDLKELFIVDETIKHLRYKTLRYIKANPYVHHNWICNTIDTLLVISLQK
jgi:hypothetical protein